MTSITAVADVEDSHGDDPARGTGQTGRRKADNDTGDAPERANAGFCWWRWRGWEVITTAAEDEASS